MKESESLGSECSSSCSADEMRVKVLDQRAVALVVQTRCE